MYFITGNSGKFKEASTILPGLEQINFDLLEIQSLDPKAIIKEKLNEAKKQQNGEFIVEDTSLYISSMNGLPGPLIKWFLESIGNEGLYKIASTFADTAAEAKTIIGHCDVNGDIQYFEGSIKGRIVSPRGPQNFGWDVIFQPDGYEKTLAEFTTEEKNAISMRGQAFKNLKTYLDEKSRN